MLMKKYKLLILIGIASLFFSSCSTVQKAFDPQRKNSSEEFLVEKKSPLSMPPDFGELPVPKNNNEESKTESEDIKLLIKEKDKNKKSSTEIEASDEDFEKLLLEKIKNN